MISLIFAAYMQIMSPIVPGRTLVDRVLDAFLEGHYLLVIVQLGVRECGQFLCELLPHFGRQVDHGLRLLCADLQKPDYN